MIKKLTYLLLMLFVGVSSTWADEVIETVGATDCTGGLTFLSETNRKTISGDGALHYTFISHNNPTATGYANYMNFLMEANDGEGNYIDMKAECAGWPFGSKDYTTGVIFSNTYDWSNFGSDLNGATVDMYIYKKGTHLIVENTITTTAGNVRKMQAYYPNVSATNLTCYPGSDHSYIEVTKIEEATLPTNVDIAHEIVGYLDCSSPYANVSSAERLLADGTGYEINFKNISLGDDNAHNWILRCYNNDATWYQNFYLLANNWAWFADAGSSETTATYTINNDFDWTNFATDMNGADLNMKVWRNNGTVYVQNAITTSTGNNWNYTFTMANITSENCNIAMSQEKALLDISSWTALSALPTTTYTINYLDANGNALKTAYTSASTAAGLTAALTDDDKADIVVEGKTYGFDSENTSNKLNIAFLNTDATKNVMNVYFKEKYTVTYNANGGSEVTDDTKYESGAEVTVKAGSVKSEANFAGWSDGNGNTYYEGNTFTITGNTTLTAQWTNHTIYSEGTVGPTDKSNTIWWTAFSPYTTIKKGETYKFTFTNNGGENDTWANYVLMAANKEGHGTQDVDGYAEYFALRADFYGWGTNYQAPTGNYSYGTDDDSKWKVWRDNMASGNFVTTMNVKFTGTQFVMTSNTTDGSETNYVYNFTSTEAAEAESAVLYFCLQSAYLTNYKAEKVTEESRTTAKGNYGTICLPYNATSEGVVLMRCAGRNSKGMVFNYVAEDGETTSDTPVENATVKAGVPYLFRATGDVKFTTTGTEYAAPTTEYNFVGVYADQTVPVNAYFLYSKNDNGEGDDMFHPAADYVNIAAYRCYLTALPDVSNAKSGVVFSIFGDDATAINSVDANVDANKVADGKFMKNGQLVIVKNGKQYNAAGQQVK